MMRQLKDYYRIMGLPRNASIEDIKTVYKKLAKEFHPDINKTPEAEAKMKEVNEAYGILGDVNKKASYDRLINPPMIFKNPTVYWTYKATPTNYKVTITINN